MWTFESIEIHEVNSYGNIEIGHCKGSLSVLIFDEDLPDDNFKSFIQTALNQGLAWIGVRGHFGHQLAGAIDSIIVEPNNFSQHQDVETALYVDEGTEECLWNALNRIGLADKYFDDLNSLHIIVKNNASLAGNIRNLIAEIEHNKNQNS